MMALDPAFFRKYVLKAYRQLEKDQQPTFTFKPLTARESLQFDDKLGGVTSGNPKRLDVAVEAIQMSLRDWKNVRDDDGLVEYGAEAVKRLPDLLTQEELLEILGVASGKVQDDEAKK